MVAFDPVDLAGACRTGRIRLPIELGREAFAPDGLGSAGAKSIDIIVSIWLVGEGGRYVAALRESMRWIEQAEAAGERYGDNPEYRALLRKRALAIGRWLTGGTVDRGLWQEARRLSCGEIVAELPDLEAFVLVEHLLDCLLSGAPEQALAAPGLGSVADSVEVRAALALAGQAKAAEAVATLYRTRPAYWLEEADFTLVAAWAMAAWFDTGLARTPESALLALYAFLEDVPVAPALAERGWREAGAEPVRLIREGGVALDRLDRIATAFGLIRDPDRGAPPDGELFASWTGPPGDTGELDYLEEDGVARIELRGRRAAMRGNALMELVDALPG